MDAEARGLRRSNRLNPELQQGEKLVAMMNTLMNAKNDHQDNVEGEIFVFEGISNIEDNCDDPIAFKASTDPDIMCMHEAMKEVDKKEFVKAMEKEVKDQMDNGNFTIVHRSEVPEGKTILPSVWQMCRKRDIRTRVIKKYKARLNINGSRIKKKGYIMI